MPGFTDPIGVLFDPRSRSLFEFSDFKSTKQSRPIQKSQSEISGLISMRMLRRPFRRVFCRNVQSDHTVAQRALVLHVQPLPQARPVEVVLARRDASGSHPTKTDRADVVQPVELLLGRGGQGLGFFRRLPPQQEAPPSRLQPLPHVEVAVHQQDGGVDPVPFPGGGLPQSHADHEDGHEELEDLGDGPRVVDDVVEVLPRLEPHRVVEEERVDDEEVEHLD